MYSTTTTPRIPARKSGQWLRCGANGEHLASNPPYGYIKDPQDKKKWIVDEEAAKVVQRIFNLCIAGKGPMQIAKILTDDKGADRHRLSRKAERLDHAGEPIPLEYQRRA